MAAGGTLGLVLCAAGAVAAPARPGTTADASAGQGAAESPPARAVQDLLDAIGQLGAARAGNGAPATAAQQQALRTVRATLDFSGISRFLLGGEWKKLSPRQRKQFESLFTAVIERRALPKAGEFFEDVSVSLGDVEREDSRVRVTTTAESKTEGRVTIDYVLSDGKDGLKVEDVILDRVSLRTNLRSEVQKVIAEESFDELLAKMRKKLEEED